MQKFNGARPIWIRVDGVCPETGLLEEGAVFEGHQGHWADCFFSNAYRREIEAAAKTDPYLNEDGTVVIIREMTDEELAKYPEALAFCEWLMEQYGEI